MIVRVVFRPLGRAVEHQFSELGELVGMTLPDVSAVYIDDEVTREEDES